MPTYSVPETNLPLVRNAVLLDTNVLLAAFHPREEFHEACREFVIEWEDPLVVPISVVIEAWGFLVGSRKYWLGALEFLAWLNNPGNAVLVPQEINGFVTIADLVTRLRIDTVDAMICRLGADITGQCRLEPPVTIATLDVGDMLKCRDHGASRVRVLDLRSMEILE